MFTRSSKWHLEDDRVDQQRPWAWQVSFGIGDSSTSLLAVLVLDGSQETSVSYIRI